MSPQPVTRSCVRCTLQVVVALPTTGVPFPIWRYVAVGEQLPQRRAKGNGGKRQPLSLATRVARRRARPTAASPRDHKISSWFGRGVRFSWNGFARAADHLRLPARARQNGGDPSVQVSAVPEPPTTRGPGQRVAFAHPPPSCRCRRRHCSRPLDHLDLARRPHLQAEDARLSLPSAHESPLTLWRSRSESGAACRPSRQ